MVIWWSTCRGAKMASPGHGRRDLIANDEPRFSFQQVKHFVFPGVQVGRRLGAPRQRGVHQGHCPAGLLRREQHFEKAAVVLPVTAGRALQGVLQSFA
jgi:hypothetical protein